MVFVYEVIRMVVMVLLEKFVSEWVFDMNWLIFIISLILFSSLG